MDVEHLSQELLARRWEVSTAAISRWELGKHTPEGENAKLIERETKLTVPPPDTPDVVISWEDRVIVLEAKVVDLEGRLAALEEQRPPRKRPSASTSPAAGTTDADLNAAVAAAREERPRRRK